MIEMTVFRLSCAFIANVYLKLRKTTQTKYTFTQWFCVKGRPPCG